MATTALWPFQPKTILKTSEANETTLKTSVKLETTLKTSVKLETTLKTSVKLETTLKTSVKLETTLESSVCDFLNVPVCRSWCLCVLDFCIHVQITRIRHINDHATVT